MKFIKDMLIAEYVKRGKRVEGIKAMLEFSVPENIKVAYQEEMDFLKSEMEELTKVHACIEVYLETK